MQPGRTSVSTAVCIWGDIYVWGRGEWKDFSRLARVFWVFVGLGFCAPVASRVSPRRASYFFSAKPKKFVFGCWWGWVYFAPGASRVSARQPSYFFLRRQKKVTKKKASHVRAASRCLALLAAFGALANSLRSNSASALIRTLLRCSARPNGGGIPHGSSASRTSPEGLVRFAHLAGVGVASFLYPHCSQGHGTPCPYILTPHSSLLIPHSSFLIPHSSFLIPHSSLLTPHSSPLTPHPSLLTPCTPHILTPHSSLLTPHSSFLPARSEGCFRLWARSVELRYPEKKFAARRSHLFCRCLNLHQPTAGAKRLRGVQRLLWPW